nr:MAG TPA: hypothetical protein [Caudoviricetes sp.]
MLSIPFSYSPPKNNFIKSHRHLDNRTNIRYIYYIAILVVQVAGGYNMNNDKEELKELQNLLSLASPRHIHLILIYLKKLLKAD